MLCHEHAKAVHLEAVTDLTSEAFRRFTGICGIYTDLYSDQGTVRIMRENFLIAKKAQAIEFGNMLAKNGPQWHLNLPAVPCQGGLWEDQANHR